MIAVNVAPWEAGTIVRGVDYRQVFATPRGLDVMAKLSRAARGVRLELDVDELEVVCEFAHASSCSAGTVLDVDAVLEEFLR